MSENTWEDIKKPNDALTDQKIINQLSSSGKEAKIKRQELERARKAREAAVKKPASFTNWKISGSQQIFRVI